MLPVPCCGVTPVRRLLIRPLLEHPQTVLRRECSVFSLIDEWYALIDNNQVCEVEIRAFLADHAGFFFNDPSCCAFPVAGLRLGNHQVDFMEPEDRYGSGAKYRLIMIGSPHTPPLGVDGRPTDDLDKALRVVKGCRHWIEANRADARRLFPGLPGADDKLPWVSYFVVMARLCRRHAARRPLPEFRDRSRSRMHKQVPRPGAAPGRRGPLVRQPDGVALAEVGVPRYLPCVRWELGQLAAGVRNTPASPFHRALSDAEWRDIVSRCDGCVSHMTARLADKLVARLAPGPRLRGIRPDPWHADSRGNSKDQGRRLR